MNSYFFLEIKTYALEHTIATFITSNDRTAASFSITLTLVKLKYISIKKKAYVIIEATQKCCHLLIEKQFKPITDQSSVSFMLNTLNKSKIKSKKITMGILE